MISRQGVGLYIGSHKYDEQLCIIGSDNQSAKTSLYQKMLPNHKQNYIQRRVDLSCNMYMLRYSSVSIIHIMYTNSAMYIINRYLLPYRINCFSWLILIGG